MTAPRQTKTLEMHADTRRVMDALRRIVRALSASARDVRARGQVSGAALFVLRQVADGPGLTITQLAARTFTGQSTVSEVVTRLADAGLLVREMNPNDGRHTVVTATPKGRRLVARAEPTAQEQLASALAALDPRTRSSLATALDAWIAEAGMAELSPSMFFEAAP